jgi:hypothetical protein
VSDRAAREFGCDGDPFRSASGPLRATRRPMSGERTTKSDNHAWYAKAGREVGREVKRQVDYSKRRREMAAHLGIDPHSSNPLIVARLDALAWAAVAGNVSAETAIGAIGGGAGEVLSTSGKINALVWQVDPEDLRERNRQRLLALCSDDFAVRQFLRRGGFTDTLRTALIDEIERLRPDTGCNDLVELAAGTRSELEARFLVNALRLLRRHAGAARGDLVVAASTIAWRGRDGELALPLPLDWLSWTTDIDAFFDQPLFRVANKIALVGGEVSLPAQRALTERGWNMELRSVYEGSPPYADEIASGLRVDGDDVPVTPLCFETDTPGTCG